MVAFLKIFVVLKYTSLENNRKQACVNKPAFITNDNLFNCYAHGSGILPVFATALVKAMGNPQAVNVVVPYAVLQMMAGAVCVVAVMQRIQLQVPGPYPYRVSTGL